MRRNTQSPQRGKLISTDPREDDWSYNACVGRNTGSSDNGAAYFHGFQTATEMLLRALLIPKPPNADLHWGEGPLIDLLIYPICYCARHHVELLLKSSLQSAWRIFRLRFPNDRQGLSAPKQDDNRHDVFEVWEELHAICEMCDQRLRALTAAMEPYIVDLNAVDASGQTFRYPRDLQSKAHLDGRRIINLKFFADGYAELCQKLRSLEWTLDELLNEYSSGVFTGKLNRADLYSIAKRLPVYGEWSGKAFEEAKRSIRDEFGLSSNDFTRACNAIKETRALAHVVGIHLPIPHLQSELFKRLRAVGLGEAVGQELNMDERSTVLALLNIGRLQCYPEELESFVQAAPEDREEFAAFETSRDVHHLARKVASRPDLIEKALQMLGQPKLRQAFQRTYRSERQQVKAQRAQRRALIDLALGRKARRRQGPSKHKVAKLSPPPQSSPNASGRRKKSTKVQI